MTSKWWLLVFGLLGIVVFFACSRGQKPVAINGAAPGNGTASASRFASFKKPSEAELKKKLTPLQFEVTQHEATEPPFDNAFFDKHEKGLYVDIVSGEPLFASIDKFDSGTGWPSFTRPVQNDAVLAKSDTTMGMTRTEVRSHYADSHLGHVFDDGPAPTGLRYCINSASLRFIPVDKLEAEGYGEWVSYVETGRSPDPKTAVSCATDKPIAAAAPSSSGSASGCSATVEVAILAGGCFWGMEDILRKIPGVIDTEVGYTGGTLKNPKYDDTHDGASGHAEAVKITFDPKKLSYADLLEKWFFKMHDPTSKDRQGNDVGSQYRSAIFYTSAEQAKTAEAIKAKVQKSGAWGKPIVTEITPASTFWRAEDYHQKYLEKNPGGYTCHFMRDKTF